MSTIILALTLTTIMTTLSFTTFSHRLNVLNSEYKKQSEALAQGCVELALLFLARDRDYTPQADGDAILLKEGSCVGYRVVPPPPRAIGDRVVITTHAVVSDAHTIFETEIDMLSLDIRILSQKQKPTAD